MQSALQRQSTDSRVINIAGRQRMLNQKLSKAALAIQVSTDAASRDKRIAELRSVLTLWKRSHESLQRGDRQMGLEGQNSAQITHMFAAIEAPHQAIVGAATALLASTERSGHNKAACTQLPPTQTILANEPAFLTGMDEIVFQI